MSDIELIEHLLVVRRHLSVLNQVRALPELIQIDKLTEKLIRELLTGAESVNK